MVALTPVEAQLTRLVAQGLSNWEVAAQLCVAPGTVAFHLRSTFVEHGITSPGQLAQLAR